MPRAMAAAALAASLALVSAAPAQALSCLRPDPIRSFLQADAAPETYLALLGAFEFDADLLLIPDPAKPVSAAPPPLTARFTGHQLGPDGFDTPVDLEVVLQPSCAGPWCGSLAPGDDVLAFARREDGALIVDLEPCPGKVQGAPDAAARDRLTACMRGAACLPDP